MKSLLPIVLLCSILLPVSTALAGGSLLGGLDKAMDPDDSPNPAGTGDPVSPDSDAPVPAPAATSLPPVVAHGATLDERIADLKQQIAEMKGVTPETIEPYNGLVEAQREVDRLRAQLERTQRDAEKARAKMSADLDDRQRAFVQHWLDLEADIEANTPPQGTDQAEWAAMCDRHKRKKAALDAAKAALNRPMAGPLDRRIVEIRKAVKDAEQHLASVREHWDGFTPGQRKFMMRMAAWKEHRARLLDAEALLRDLEKLKADLAGATQSRKDPIEEEAIEKTGYLLSDALARLVLRELTLSDATNIPIERDLNNGLPLPEFQELFDRPTNQEARVIYAEEELRLAEAALDRVEQDINDEDAAMIGFLRDLECDEEEIKAESDHRARTREQRIKDLTLRRQVTVKYWADRLEREAAELNRMITIPEQPEAQPATESDSQ